MGGMGKGLWRRGIVTIVGVLLGNLVWTGATAQILTAEHTFNTAPSKTQPFRLPEDEAFNDHQGYQALFDGKTLTGWDGDPKVWRVEKGTIVGERSAGASNNDYLVYRPLKVKNFDLKVEIRVLAGGSGIQYRSRTGEPWVNGQVGSTVPRAEAMMTGPQADLWSATPPLAMGSQPVGMLFNGQVYIENSPRRVVAWRGDITAAQRGALPKRIGSVGDATALEGYVSGGWNQYRVVARDGVVIHILNGRVMAVHIDDDPLSPDNQAGLFGIEAELNPARIEVRSVWVRKIS